MEPIFLVSSKKVRYANEKMRKKKPHTEARKKNSRYFQFNRSENEIKTLFLPVRISSTLVQHKLISKILGGTSKPFSSYNFSVS